MNLCVRCEMRFAKWSEYHSHVTGTPCRIQVKPVNTSGRSRAQIIQNWEMHNQGALIQ